MKKTDYKRQLVVANSLFEMGLDMKLISKITTVSSNDLDKYRLEIKNNIKDIDKNP